MKQPTCERAQSTEIIGETSLAVRKSKKTLFDECGIGGDSADELNPDDVSMAQGLRRAQ